MEKTYIVLIIALILERVSCQVQYLYSKSPLNQNLTKLPIQSITYGYSHHSIISPNNSQVYINNFDASNNLSFTAYNLTLNSSYQIRTFVNNSFFSLKNIFLIFSRTEVRLYQNNLRNLSYLYNVSNILSQVIVDAMFLPNLIREICVLVSNMTLGNYSLMYFYNKTLVNMRITKIPTTFVYSQMILTGGRILILFNSGIFVYSANSTLNFIQFIQFPLGTTSFGFSASNSYLVYYQDMNCFLANFTTLYQIIYIFDTHEKIIDIKLSAPFVYLCFSTKIQQYDLNEKIVVFSLPTTTNLTGYRSFMNLDKYLLFYKPYPNNSPSIEYYKVDYTLPCINSCPNCLPSYQYNLLNNKCMKNLATPIIFPPLNTSNATNLTNIVDNITNLINLTINQTVFNSSIFDFTNQTIQGQNNENNLNQAYILSILGLTLIFTSMKFSPKFLVSLALFLDDLYYYKFHRHNYTQAAQFFMQRVELINDLRLNPGSCFFFINKLKNNAVAVTENQKYSLLISPHLNNPEQLYFIHSTENIYKKYLILLIFSFVVIKFLSLIFYLLSNIKPSLKYASRYLMNQTNILCFISSFIEANFTEIVFFTGIQLLLPVKFKFFDSINLMVCVLSLFCVFSYAILFYPLLFLIKNKKSTCFLMIRSKFCRKGTKSESICIYLRIFFRTLIHGILIEHYETQIILLVIIDVFSLLLTYYLRGGFFRKSGFLCIFLYNLLFLLLDSLFLAAFKLDRFIDYQKYDQAVFVIICGLIGLFLLISLNLLLLDLKKLWNRFYKLIKNKQNELTSDKQNQIKKQQEDKINSNPIFNSANFSQMTNKLRTKKLKFIVKIKSTCCHKKKIGYKTQCRIHTKDKKNVIQKTEQKQVSKKISQKSKTKRRIQFGSNKQSKQLQIVFNK